MLRRTLAAIGLAALVLSVLAPATLATGPTRDYMPMPPTIEFAPGDVCAFAVRIDVLVNTEYGETFRDAEGNVTRQIIAGRLIVAVTNESNDASITVNISGPGEIIPHPDGGWTYILRGNSMPFGPGFLLLTTGVVVQEYASDGTLLSTTHATGTETDVCAVLG